MTERSGVTHDTVTERSGVTDGAVRAAPPTLRIVRGAPTDAELAALTVVLAAVGTAAGTDAAPRARPRWNDPAGVQRRQLAPGPGAWQRSHWPS